MKVKIGQLLGAMQSNALQRLASTALPIKTSMRVTDVLTAVQKELQNYELERTALCMELGELNAETNEYDFETEEIKQDFFKRADALLHREVEIPGETFTRASFLSSTVITPNDLLALEWLIRRPEPVETNGHQKEVKTA